MWGPRTPGPGSSRRASPKELPGARVKYLRPPFVGPMGLCKAVTTAGRECASPALLDEEYCLWHHPQKEAERQAASAKGGSAPRRIGVDLGKALARPEVLDDP